jgi:hypothetical protein
MHDFLGRYTRYQTHVYAYAILAADPFPPFGGREGTYPIDLRIAPPKAQSRLTVFFRILLAIPALIISGVMNYLVEILAIFAWFVCLALGRMPEGMRNLLAFTIRYHAQTQAYMYLVTDRYPSLNVGLA